MGLKDHVDLRKTALARGRQGGPNLCGMMSVVVNHADAPDPSPQLKATIHSPEVFQGRGNLLGSKVQTDAHRNRGGCIQDVVGSRNLQQKLTKAFPAINHLKPTQAGLLACCPYFVQRLDSEVGPLANTVG